MSLGLSEDLELSDLVLGGNPLSADIRSAVVGEPELTRALDSPDLVRLEVNDYDRKLLRSKLLTQRTPLYVDGLGFELVQVAKRGDNVELTFEDLAVASLRKHKGLLVAAADVTTRAEFVRRLAGEEPWLRVEGPSGAPVREQLSRGRPIKPGTEETADKLEKQDDEDSWSAMTRIADEVAWRVFTIGRTVVYAPDSWLIARPVALQLREFAGGVDFIDFDFDVGKGEATATVGCRLGRWSLSPGDPVEVLDLGAADGLWLVGEVRRPLLSSSAELRLVRPRPELPEPEGDGMSSGAEVPLLDVTGQSTGDPNAVPTGGAGGANAAGQAAASRIVKAPERSTTRRAADFVVQVTSQVESSPLPSTGYDVYTAASLVAWAAQRVGVQAPASARELFGACRTMGSFFALNERLAAAALTSGALLFAEVPGVTVAVVIGNNEIVEVHDARYRRADVKLKGGALVSSRTNTYYTSAAYLPGLQYLQTAPSDIIKRGLS